MLDRLLERVYEYAFVSNADNLGAVVEPRIVSWLAAGRVLFAMEVVAGTEADRKGGHIARRGGRLVLRETAQTPPEDADSFRDVGRWRFYNTNNLWIHVPTLAEVVAASQGARPPADRQPQDRRSGRPVQPRRHPARDRDGRCDRRVRRRARDLRAAQPLRAGQDDR
jgi:UTP--glucose-1-phosphate uridylyltransferase